MPAPAPAPPGHRLPTRWPAAPAAAAAAGRLRWAARASSRWAPWRAGGGQGWHVLECAARAGADVPSWLPRGAHLAAACCHRLMVGHTCCPPICCRASPPPRGAVPFSVKHSEVAAPQRSRLPTAGAGNAFSGPAAAYRRSAPLEGFMLSPDSFSSQPSPAVFTRGSPSAAAPAADPAAQPSRFAEARRAAAAAQRPGDAP